LAGDDAEDTSQYLDRDLCGGGHLLLDLEGTRVDVEGARPTARLVRAGNAPDSAPTLSALITPPLGPNSAASHLVGQRV
jgi:hypothetical protein